MFELTFIYTPKSTATETNTIIVLKINQKGGMLWEVYNLIITTGQL